MMRAHCWRTPVSDTSFARMPAEVTEDAVLGGKLRLKQPSAGHRVGHDAILLAAACPARAGERVVDLGAGVGAAGLAPARRVDGVKVVLVEVDAALAALAAENAQLNGLGARVSAVALDVAGPARAFTAAGLVPDSATRILMNPPFNDPARGAEPFLQVYPGERQPAVRVLVRATKASRGPLMLLPGLILNGSSGRPTAQAEAVLRGDTG